MANKPLQSITFPELDNKYTVPVVDNTLTTTGAAADAKKTGDEITSIKEDLSEIDGKVISHLSTVTPQWEVGAINQNGGNAYLSTRIRIKDYISPQSRIVQVNALDGYEFEVVKYSASNVCEGMLCSDGVFRTSGGTPTWKTHFDLWKPEYAEKKFRFALRNASDPSATMTVEDSSNCVFLSSTDTTLSKPGCSADAEVVGAELSTVKNKLDKAEIEEYDFGYDLAIGDDDNNTLVGFKDGGIITKNFDSRNLPNQLEAVDGKMKSKKVDTDICDLAVADSTDSSIVVFKNGGIETKNFDSSVLPMRSRRYSCWAGYEGEEINLCRNVVNVYKLFRMNTWPSQTLQGGGVYGDHFFQFDNTCNYCCVYNMKTGAFEQQITFEPETNFHCNCVVFGTQFYDASDPFPVLYVSSTFLDKIRVYRITGDIGSLEFEIIQTIYTNQLETESIGNYDACIDSEFGYFILFDNVSGGRAVAYHLFNIPSLSEAEVSLTNADIIKEFSVSIPSDGSVRQHAISHCGKLYMLLGQTGGRYIQVVDIEREKQVSMINLNAPNIVALEGGQLEPEAITIYDGMLVFTDSSRILYGLRFGRQYYDYLSQI